MAPFWTSQLLRYYAWIMLLGAKESQIESVSLGEEKPRCEDRTDIEPIHDQMESDAVGCLDQMRRLFPPRS